MDLHIEAMKISLVPTSTRFRISRSRDLDAHLCPHHPPVVEIPSGLPYSRPEAVVPYQSHDCARCPGSSALSGACVALEKKKSVAHQMLGKRADVLIQSTWHGLVNLLRK